MANSPLKVYNNSTFWKSLHQECIKNLNMYTFCEPVIHEHPKSIERLMYKNARLFVITKNVSYIHGDASLNAGLPVSNTVLRGTGNLPG